MEQETRHKLSFKNKRNENLQEVHDSITRGHLGVTKIIAILRKRVYWMNCEIDANKWSKKCGSCAASDGPQKRLKALILQYNVG